MLTKSSRKNNQWNVCARVYFTLRNWKRTASQQEFHKDVVWQSWKRWGKSYDGYRLRLNSKPNDVCLNRGNKTLKMPTQELTNKQIETDKKTTISALIGEMATQSSRTNRLKLTKNQRFLPRQKQWGPKSYRTCTLKQTKNQRSLLWKKLANVQIEADYFERSSNRPPDTTPLDPSLSSLFGITWYKACYQNFLYGMIMLVLRLGAIRPFKKASGK